MTLHTCLGDTVDHFDDTYFDDLQNSFADLVV